MLTILTELAMAMIAQARADHPIETCGVIAGPAGSNLPLRLIPMRNVAMASDFFEFDSQQHFQVWKEMEACGEEPIVLYHSHTQSRAYPSREDVLHAVEPQAHYVIITTDSASGQPMRSFRIVDGKVIEETIKTVDRYSTSTHKNHS